MAKSDAWKEIAKKKRQEQWERIPTTWRISRPEGVFRPIEIIEKSEILSAQELEWTDPQRSIAAVLESLAHGEVTAEQLTIAFCKRAAIAHQLTNCLTEIMFSEAIERSKGLDREFKSTGKLVGPFHGIPITVKDHMDVEGFDSSTGISSLCFDPAKSNSKLVQIFVDRGAVVIAKTNVPQTCLAADTINVVFGRTTNAVNSAFGAGGSSGGEGAVIALGGSKLGLGSDGAGSIRMPAAANGAVGYRPSGYRLPADGRTVFGHGMVGLVELGPVAVFGFLSQSLQSIRTASKLVCDAKPWESDPFLYPTPWLGLTPPRPRIGVWPIDVPTNGFHLFPPVKRGFLHAQDLLRRAGYELVEFPAPDITKVWGLCKDWLEIQGLFVLRKYLADEPYTQVVKDTGILIPPNPRPIMSIEYLHDMNLQLAKLAVAMNQAWFSSGQGIDALLWVTAPNTALPFDKWTDTTFTTLFNAVDWPAVALPLSIQSDKSIDLKQNLKPFNENDAQLQSLYDPETFDKLPLSVQLVARRFEDEKLLAIAEEVHAVILGKSGGP